MKIFVMCLQRHNADLLIGYVNNGLGAASIECGAVEVDIQENALPAVESFLNGMGVIYEINHKHPSIVRREVINQMSKWTTTRK